MNNRPLPPSSLQLLFVLFIININIIITNCQIYAQGNNDRVQESVEPLQPEPASIVTIPIAPCSPSHECMNGSTCKHRDPNGNTLCDCSVDRQHCSTEHIAALKLLRIAWTPQPERNSFVPMVHFAIHRLWNVYVQMDMGGSIASFDRIRYHIFIVAGNKKILYLRA